MANTLSVLTELRNKMLSAPLADVVTGVFDEQAPDDQPGPYIVIGYTIENEGRLLADSERAGVVRLHIWSDRRGKSEVLNVFELLDAAINDSFTLFNGFNVMIDPSGWTHGVAEYRYYFDRSDT